MPRKKQKFSEGEWTSSFTGESKVSSELRKLTNSAGWVAATHKLVPSKLSPGSSRASTPPSTVSSSSKHSSSKGSKNGKKSRGRPPGKSAKKFKMVLEKDEDFEVDYVSPDEETTMDESDPESKGENSDMSDDDEYSLDDDDEDDMSSIGNESAQPGDFSDVEMDDDFPPLELPESSKDLLIPNNLLLQALGIYEVFRHFRSSLRLSPMLFEDFCAALIDSDTNILLTECYISVLKALLREEDAAGVQFGPSDQNDGVRVAFNFLDHMTWPEVVRSYLESFFSEYSSAVKVLRNPKFPNVDVEGKIIVLKTLTDIYLASNKIRDQLMTDGVIHYDDHCRVCHKLGDLLCCETCPAVYHLACCDPPLEEVPDDEWQCEVCAAHKLNGVFNCEPQHEFRGQYLRHEPIGTDRQGNKYWFLARRLIIEGQSDVWYYSTQEQFDYVLSMLDPDRYEMVLCEALKDVAEEFPKYSRITQELTDEALPSDKTKPYLDVLKVRVKREVEEKKKKEENKRREEEEKKKKEEESRRKEKGEKEDNGHNIADNVDEEERKDVTDISTPTANTISSIPDHPETAECSNTSPTSTAVTDAVAANGVTDPPAPADSESTEEDSSRSNSIPANPLSGSEVKVANTTNENAVAPSSDDPGQQQASDVPATTQSPQKNIQVIKLGQGVQVKAPTRTSALSTGTLSQLKTLYVLNKDGTKTPIMLGPAGKIVTPANNANSSSPVNRQLLVLNSAKVALPKVNRELKKLQFAGPGPKTVDILSNQVNNNQQVQPPPSSNQKTNFVSSPVLRERSVEPAKNMKPLTHSEEAEEYFRLGEDKAYKQYVNHYTENSLALNKYQHKEERDRERLLGYKFSMTGEGDFKWMGDVLGSESTMMQTLRSTLMHLEHQIPLCFMHTRWDKYRNAWGKIVMKCQTPQSFAAALGILEMATRAAVKKSVWKDSHGLTRLQRVTPSEKEEFDKRRKHRTRADEDESNKNAVWCKYPIPVRSTLVWKMKGEEYRMTGYGGWFWVSSTRHSVNKPWKPKPYTLVHEMSRAETPTKDASSSLKSDGTENYSGEKRELPLGGDVDTDSEKSTSTTSTTTTKSADLAEEHCVFESLVQEATSDMPQLAQTVASGAEMPPAINAAKAESDSVEVQTPTKDTMTSPTKCVTSQTIITEQSQNLTSSSSSEPMDVDTSVSPSPKKDSPDDARRLYHHIINSSDVINVSENLLKRTPLYNKKWSASKVDILLGWRIMHRDADKKKENTTEPEKQAAVTMTTEKSQKVEVIPTSVAKINTEVTMTTDINKPSDVTMATTTANTVQTNHLPQVVNSKLTPTVNDTVVDSDEIDVESVGTVDKCGSLVSKPPAFEGPVSSGEGMKLSSDLSEAKSEVTPVISGAKPANQNNENANETETTQGQKAEPSTPEEVEKRTNQVMATNQEVESTATQSQHHDAANQGRETGSDKEKAEENSLVSHQGRMELPADPNSEDSTVKLRNGSNLKLSSVSSALTQEALDSDNRDATVCTVSENPTTDAVEKFASEGAREQDVSVSESTDPATSLLSAGVTASSEAKQDRSPQSTVSASDSSRVEDAGAATETNEIHDTREKISSEVECCEELVDTVVESIERTSSGPDQKVTVVETVTTTVTMTTTVNKTVICTSTKNISVDGRSNKCQVGATGALLTKLEEEDDNQATKSAVDPTSIQTSGESNVARSGDPVCGPCPGKVVQSVGGGAQATLNSNAVTVTTRVERSRTRASRMSRVRSEVRQTQQGKTVSTTEKTWKLQRYRKTSTTLKREKTMKLPLPWKFCAGKGRKKSIFRLPAPVIRKLALSGGFWLYHAGFNYGAKWFSGLEMFWFYLCPRPTFNLVWRYKLQNVCTFASIAHLLRIFWHAMRWDKITMRPQTDDVVHTVTTDEDIVTTELLKRKDDPTTGLHSQYYIRRITMPILDPEEEALRAIKPGENYTPSRKGLRSSTRPFSLRDRPKKEGPQVEMIWVPEEQVELWQIRQFDSMLKQQQQRKGTSLGGALQTSSGHNAFLSNSTIGLLPTLQNIKAASSPGVNIMKIPMQQSQQYLQNIQGKLQVSPSTQTFLDKKSYNVMIGKPHVQKIIVQPPGQSQQFPAYKTDSQQQAMFRSSTPGTHYIVQGGKLIKPIIIKAGSHVVSSPLQTKPAHPTIRLNDGSSQVIKFQQQPPPVLPTLKKTPTSKLAPRSPNQTQIKLSSSQLAQLMKVGIGTPVRVSVSLGNGRAGVGQIQLIPPGAQVTPSSGQQLMQTRVQGELKRFLFTLISESVPVPVSAPSLPNEVSLQTASLSQRILQMQKHHQTMHKRQNTDMRRLLTDKDPLWGSRPQTPERSTFTRREVERPRKKPMSREEREESQRNSVVVQVMKSILDRIERREDVEMRKRKREEAILKQKEKKELTEQAKVHNRQTQILHRHRDQLKQDILRRRAVVEKYLTHSAKNELREDQRKQRRHLPASESTPVSKRPKKTFGNAIVTSAVLTENNAKRPTPNKNQNQQPIAPKKRRTVTPPPESRKQKMISTHAKKNKDTKLYCVCKTPYDQTKFYIGCDLCMNWFHGTCVGIPESRAKFMNEWVCEDCQRVKEEPAQELYCLCRTPYDDSKFYIGCDICQDWYHGTCVGVTEKESENIEFYSCPRCSKDNMKGKDAALTENKLSQEDYIALTKIVRSLRAHKMAWPFLQPVSKLEVPNYYKVVKRPMDLGTIMQRLRSYTLLSDLVGDVSLIFDNCRMFNGADSALAKCAEIVESVFVGKIREFRARRGQK